MFDYLVITESFLVHFYAPMKYTWCCYSFPVLLSNLYMTIPYLITIIINHLIG